MPAPEAIRVACAPLFEAIPPEQAMPDLVGGSPKFASVVDAILQAEPLKGRLDLAAALWLYVDDLDRSHRASQANETVTGSLWHGIMHRREGDFQNSRHWMRQAAGHPLLAALDPAGFVDLVEADAGRNDPALIQRQREEWRRLFDWCSETN